MKKFILLGIQILLGVTFQTALIAQDTLQAVNLKPFGRHLFTSEKHLELIGSASSISVQFTGKTCQIVVYITNPTAHNYLQYELDGVYQQRIRVHGPEKLTFIIDAPGEGVHIVKIFKATEAHTGPIFIEKIVGSGIQPLSQKEAPVIEFIGDSITCGAASDPSEFACGSGQYHDQHNAYYAYGPRIGRALGINYFLSSVSGIGIYRNWNSDGPTMPQVYENSDLQLKSGRLWDFKSLTPDIVSIALGTNDFSKGDGKHTRLPFDSTTFVKNYIQFVSLVKSKYPKAQIVLLSSPMIGGSKLKNCINAVKQNIDLAFPEDKPISIYFFTPMQPRGCSWHPSVEDHAVMATELTPLFKSLLPSK